MAENVAKPSSRAAFTAPIPLQPLALRRSGVSKYIGDPLAEPERTIAQPRVQPAVESDLVRRLVYDRGHGPRRVGPGENLVDLRRRA